MDIQPIILSGGSGSRLWPLSREHYPKQLLPLIGELSLLQETLNRLDGFNKAEQRESAADLRPPLIVCNEQHRFLVAEQARQIGKTPEKIILEPFGRNTAPALTLAALSVIEENNDVILLVMPADHVIQDSIKFHHAISTATKLAEEGNIVTFGIKPTGPETGYGYIKVAQTTDHFSPQENYFIESFVEKPNLEQAVQYVSSGNYLWNSGMFIMQASTWLAAIDRYRSDIKAACEMAISNGYRDMDFFRVDAKQFEKCPGDSIDYAVMEKIVHDESHDINTRAVVVPLDAGWSDVGAWSALWEVGERDGDGNVVKGDVYTHDSKNNLVTAENRLVTVVGVENHIIVETADAVMVVHKEKSQDVKHVVDWLKAQNRHESLFHQRVYRPWGSYEGVVAGERFQVKRIIVNTSASLSLQMHHHRAEHWIVVRGTARVTRGDEVFLITENQSTYIPLGVTHRLENPGTIPLEIIEVQSGSYLGEDDIVRFEDNYGRNQQVNN